MFLSVVFRRSIYAVSAWNPKVLHHLQKNSGPLDSVLSKFISVHPHINPLNTKRRLLYLNTQFVPRSKHFSSRL